MDLGLDVARLIVMDGPLSRKMVGAGAYRAGQFYFFFALGLGELPDEGLERRFLGLVTAPGFFGGPDALDG